MRTGANDYLIVFVVMRRDAFALNFAPLLSLSLQAMQYKTRELT
jgi:hypothetical protein